jgi:DNA-binding GntR family transcriptional regulator
LSAGVEAGARALPRAQRPPSVPTTTFVYDYVKRLVVELVLEPGSLTTEAEIASAVGVSRTPVREAFLRLDAERLIRLLPRRGALITPVTVRQVRELNDTRLVMELHAAREVCAHRIPAAARMREHLERQTALLAQDAPIPELIASDRAFHLELVRATGNRYLTDLYASTGDHQQRLGTAAFAAAPGRAARALEHHRELVAALAAFDAAAAEQTLRDHLQTATAELERYLPE